MGKRYEGTTHEEGQMRILVVSIRMIIRKMMEDWEWRSSGEMDKENMSFKHYKWVNWQEKDSDGTPREGELTKMEKVRRLSHSHSLSRQSEWDERVCEVKRVRDDLWWLKEELTKLMKQPFRKLQKPDEDRIKGEKLSRFDVLSRSV